MGLGLGRGSVVPGRRPGLVADLAGLGSGLGSFPGGPPTLLPAHGHDSYELLSYYLCRTANSMGNGSTDVNPFVPQLIPLAFCNPLVLQLLLAQSAAHRQASRELEARGDVAARYYTDSLCMFRTVVGEFVAGQGQGKTLTLTVGSLILFLTEMVSSLICVYVYTCSQRMPGGPGRRLRNHLRPPDGLACAVDDAPRRRRLAAARRPV